MNAPVRCRVACAALAVALAACGPTLKQAVRIAPPSSERAPEELASPVLAGPILAIHPVSAALVYAASDGGGIVRSTDSGRTWQKFSTGAPDVYVTHFAHSSRSDIFAATLGGGIIKLPQGSDTWVRVDRDALPQGALDRVNDILVSPFDNIVYAATLGHGVYRSTDLGATWREYDEGLHIMNVNVIACTEQNTLFARCVGGGIFYRSKSMDRWMPMNDGLDDPYVTSMEAQRNGTVVIGTRNGTVYHLNTLGNHWDSVGTGTSGAYITSVATTSDGHIVAGTKIGLYRWVRSHLAWELVHPIFHDREIRVVETAPGGMTFAGMTKGSIIAFELSGE